MRALSGDLRKRVIAAKEKGEGSAETAKRFGLGKRTVDGWWKTYRESGRSAPLQQGGHRRSALEGHDAVLNRWIKEKPCITLRELSERCLKELGLRIGKTGIDNRLKAIDLSYKKNDARFRAGAGRHQGGKRSVATRSKRMGRQKADLP
jgi:transposase